MAATPPLLRTQWATSAGLAFLLLAMTTAAGAAEPSYPFEGTWMRADRACVAASPLARTYTAKEVISARGRCSIRRIAGGPTTFELLEECRRNERPQNVTETVRLVPPDGLVLKRQLSRLKIPRQVRFARCTVAAPAGGAMPKPSGKATAPVPDAAGEL